MKKFIICCEEYVEEFGKRDAKKIEKAMRGFSKSEIDLSIEVVFAEEEQIRELNREKRNVDSVTDVLSFPSFDSLKDKEIKKSEFASDTDEKKRLMIGSVVVCVNRAKEQAEEYGHSLTREINYLIVHGIMHCFGYDHMTDEEKREMREKEEYILGKMKITREE